MTWLSIATVVKDDAGGFAQTLGSVQRNVHSGVEWVVLDGSADCNAVPELLSDVPSDLDVTYVHETPRGIYPAMNSALARCKGDYVLFLNAGDALHDATVLSRIHESVRNCPVWAFGPVEIVEQSGKHVITPPWNYAMEKAAAFSRGHFPPHQGTVVSRSALVGAGGFDPSYRIAADYAMAMKLSLVSDPLVLPFIVATFHEGGISTQSWRESFREFHRARVEILRPAGTAALRERWETVRHFALVYAAREIRPRLSWRVRH